MTPIWLAVPALVTAALIGLAIERACGPIAAGGHPSAAWLTRTLLGLAAYVASVVHPLLGPVLVAGVVLFARRSDRGAPLAAARPPYVALASVAVAALVLVARPAVPLAWDEAVWLARARVACTSPWALASRALDPGGGLVPSGYPVGASALHAALSVFDDSLSSLVAGASVLVLLSIATFALSLSRARSVTGWAAALVLCAAPLAWAHALSGTLDLPLGLLSASFALALTGAARGDRHDVLLAPALACVLSAMKDEGALHVLSIAGSMAALSPAAVAARRHAAVGAAWALVVVVTWRVRTALAGVAAEHHHAVGMEGAIVVPILRELGRAATDLGSFGAALAVSSAATLATVLRGGRSLSRAVAVATLAVLTGAVLAIVIGPEAVHDFALEGTVFPRLLVQVLPLGALVVGASIAEREGDQPPAGETPAGTGQLV